MNDISEPRLRDLPSVDRVLNDPRVQTLSRHYGRELAVFTVRQAIDSAREAVRAGKTVELDAEQLAAAAVQKAEALAGRSLKPIINAAGVILHTNLGRAPLGQGTADELREVLAGYTNLEFDLSKGTRGKRTSHVAPQLRYLTGAEDIVITNNNSAATLLTVGVLAAGREIIISRGELVEIGDSFRIPDVIAAAGARMVEVGTTNRTHLADYERAISPATALIFKAHTSNYAVRGFTSEVSVAKLAELAHAKGLPMVYDIGSGLLRPHPLMSPHGEPDVQTALTDGADLVLFSCDKLLGGPQAGIVAGRRELAARLAKAPLMRALRVDKLTITAISMACRQLICGTPNPFFFFMQRTPAEREALARALQDRLAAAGLTAEVAGSPGQTGGGSLPDVTLESFAVSLKPPCGWQGSPESFAEKTFSALLRGDPPVLGVLRKGELLFDVLTLYDKDLDAVAAAVSAALRSMETA